MSSKSESGAPLPSLEEIARSDIHAGTAELRCRLQESWAKILRATAWRLQLSMCRALVVARMPASHRHPAHSAKSSQVESLGRSPDRNELFADDDHAAAGVAGRVEAERM